MFIPSRDSSRIGERGDGGMGEEGSVGDDGYIIERVVSSRFSPMMTSFISLARVMLDIECRYWGNNNSFRGKGEGEVLKRWRRLSV